MALTANDFSERELQFLKKLKGEGVSSKDAFKRLESARSKMSGGGVIPQGSTKSAVSPNAPILNQEALSAGISAIPGVGPILSAQQKIQQAAGQEKSIPQPIQEVVTEQVEEPGFPLTQKQREGQDLIKKAFNPSLNTEDIEENQELIKRAFMSTKKGSDKDNSGPNVFERAVEGFRGGVEAAEESRAGIAEAQARGEIGLPRAALEQAGAGLQSLFLPVGRAIEGAAEPVTEAVVDFAGKVASGITPDQIEEPLKKAFVAGIQEAQKEFEALDPQTQRSLGNVARSFEALLTIAGAGAGGAATKGVGKPALKKALKGATTIADEATQVAGPAIKAVGTVADTAASGVEAVEGAIKKLAQPLAQRAANKKQIKIQDLIGPEFSKKTRQKAIREGRVEQTANSFLRGRQFKISPEQAIKEASEVIENRIKGASNMSPVKLADAIADETSKITNALKPAMKKSRINKARRDKAFKAWERLKKQQQDLPEFDNFPGAAKVQKKFERFLDETLKPSRGPDGRFVEKSLDDLWANRIGLDANVPSRIKKLDITDPKADPFAVLQKQMWLENRAILNDMMLDQSTALGKNARKQFDDMSKMLNARENIIQRAEIKERSGAIKKLFKGALKVGGGIGLFNLFAD